MDEAREYLVEIEVIRDSIQSQAGCLQFSDDEFAAVLHQLESDNACMVVDGQITVI